MSDKVVGFVLPEDAVSTMETQVFPGLPGEWMPGTPIAWTDLGFESAKAAEEAVKASGAPLKRVASVEPVGDALRGVAPSGADEGLPRSSSPMPGLSAEEFEARLAEGPAPVLETLAAGSTNVPVGESKPVESKGEES